MPRLPRRRPAHPRPVLLLVAAAALLAGGCTDAGEEGSGTPVDGSAAGQRPLADYEATGFTLPRTSPCPDLADAAVVAALGDEVTDASAYQPGERAELAPGVRDVAQEAGCVFRGQDGVEARAWVFAPPVSADRAKDVARQLRREQGCRRLDDAPAFGEPGVGRTCERGQVVVGSYGGLFGDAWLGCSVAVPASAVEGDQGSAALVRRTGTWCVTVLEAARQASDAAGS